ncbi:nickel-dependent hydrogenase large subunit [Seleniivibrio woodruffii]|uniref:Hydrogenase large subunit n=1 Tax=Seleniivibrio woodruffii TaxID=1078050 RepID=A0A4R1KDP8_9BACT|nr:nickel-dependent hydrogenase large subunit [Seleniivibrio woodruffii]TCK62123.1 hydrogenase large subunit [Seleniivibrio woodruffii]TVZ34760.1 hydrogenase large subunit [Seleniivibrio woodruffii]
MSDRIVVDPITRIEGHLRIEAKIENGVITNAFSSGTMFRGIEKILQGRDPRDAWYITQRFCGVCTTVHAIASVRAVENALNIHVPFNAELIRNIIMGSQCVQDHVIHFYHLHALDWVDITSALQADPAKTAQLQQAVSDWKYSSEDYFKSIKDRLTAFVNTGRLGPFANAYWGHSAYKLPPEANLMAAAHYLQALELQKEIIKIHAVLGSKNPHPQTFLVGGMSLPIDPNSQNALNADRIAMIMEYNKLAKEFVEKVYIPDVLAVAPFYLDWAGIGAGHKNYMSYGEYPETNKGYPYDLWLPAGIIMAGDLSNVMEVDQSKIAEDTAHSWYVDKDSKHPFEGASEKRYTGPKPPYEFLDVEKDYSFVKAPRYNGVPMEVGPLARVLVAYAKGHAEIKPVVDSVLSKLGAGPEALFSTLGRTAARAIETLVIVNRIDRWIADLASNIKAGDYSIHAGEKWEPETWPKQAMGYGWHEAPRGALGHWIVIEDGKIKNYQAVVPSTWNAGPMDKGAIHGPYEQSLIGTPIADPNKPLEILRTIHSFDPCLACAVHVTDEKGVEISKVKVL